MKGFVPIILLLACLRLSAQNLSHQPIVGGVTEQSARIYLKTGDTPSPFVLEISEDGSFGTLVAQIPDSTRTSGFGSVVVDVDGLQAGTRYHYRTTFNGVADAKQGSFKTFPALGSDSPLKIVVGSCNYFDEPAVFPHIQAFEPDLFIHLGDWNWPPAQLGNDYNLYPDKRAASFASRYADQNMATYVMPFTAVDYVYDDDYSYNDSEGWTYPTFEVIDQGGAPITNLYTNPMPAGIREGAIQGYFEHFPAYPAVDTAHGIHHSFRMGNLEIFMLDTRNSRMPRHDAFVYDADSGEWSFEPDSVNHSMLGTAQREWLLDGIQNSDADWKIIGSSVVFNKYYGTIADVAMALQGINIEFGGQPGTGLTLASNLVYNWVGYPADQQPLLNLYESGTIKDVVLLSGDSHASAIDDGSNAGLPEMMASGLSSQNEGFINYYIDSVGQLLTFPPAIEILWNGGGNGLGENKYNFNDSFGTLEVFGSDSLRMCVIDEFGQTMGCITLTHSSLSTSTEPAIHIPNEPFTLLYPNPAKDRIRLLMRADYHIQSSDQVILSDQNGRAILRMPLRDVAAKGFEIPIATLPAGAYILSVSTPQGLSSRKFVVGN